MSPALLQNCGHEFTRILALGAARGDLTVTNDEIAGPINSSDEWIRQRTGVITRKRASRDLGAVDASGGGDDLLRVVGPRSVDRHVAQRVRVVDRDQVDRAERPAGLAYRGRDPAQHAGPVVDPHAQDERELGLERRCDAVNLDGRHAASPRRRAGIPSL